MQTLTLAEAAAFLKTTEDTVSAKIRNEGLPAAKVGRAYVLVDVDIIEWLRRQYGRRSREGNSCDFSSEVAVTTGGSSSATAGDRLEKALARPIAARRKSTQTTLKPISGDKAA
jgi:excisionase family DNA binding protein